MRSNKLLNSELVYILRFLRNFSNALPTIQALRLIHFYLYLCFIPNL